MHLQGAVLLLFILALVRGLIPGPPPELKSCKELLTYSYAYDNFYHLEDENTTDVLVEVYVQAVSDAHVLLSTASYPEESEAVYEVVLGAGRNTFSEIRRQQRSSTKAYVRSTNLLSSSELRGFWVRLTPAGIIKVGNKDNEVPFLFWKDPQPLRIRYVSFCTWTGVAGKFLFDCHAPDSSESSETSEVAPTEMTTLEALRSDLLTNYDPYSRPVLHEDHYTTVYVHLSSHHVQLDEKKSLLSIHGRMSMNWIDEKVVWDPESYNNISVLNLASHEAWLPELVLYNAAGHGADILDDAGLVISSEGRARWAPQTRLQSWCNDLDLRLWPHDQHTCTLRLGFWAQQQPRLNLQLDNHTEISEQKTGSEWEVVDFKSLIVWDTEVWANGFSEYEKQLNEVPTSNLVIEITLRRQAQSYRAVLTAPLIVINAITFLSFWMSPNNFAKTLFVCLALIMSSVLAVVLTDVVPVHHTHLPFIVAAYSRSMVAALISLLLSVITICLGRYNHMRPLPAILYKHIASEHVSNVLFLPRTESKETSQYHHLDETSQTTHSTSVSHQDVQQQWTILAVFVDRICSILFCILVAIVLATC